jgi:integrase
MATIRQRGNRWQVIIKRKGYPPQTKTFNLRKDAEKWGRLQERLIDAGQWVDRTEAEQTTLEELLDRYQREVSPSKKGANIEKYYINTFKKSEIAKYSVAAITGQLIAKWRDERVKEVSDSSVSRELTLLSHVFTVAIKEWGFALNHNPVGLVRKPSSNPPRNRVLADQQRQSLITACKQCKNPWIYPVVVFAMETAARRGEILNLTWKDVDLQRRTAKVNGKTGYRTIPLSPTCISTLKALPRSIGGKVFPVTIETLKQAYPRAVARAGIEDFTFHDLRHDALTRLAKLGLNILELRAISGHTTANMLQRYVSIDASELAQKLSKL